MPSRHFARRCLWLALGTIGWAGLCLAQNDNGRFVASSYVAVLGRQPDPSGWNFWVTDLNNHDPRDTMLNAFLSSGEYGSVVTAFVAANWNQCWNSSYHTPAPGTNPNAQFLYIVYWQGLGRCADSGGYNFWLGLLDTGLSKATALSDIVASAEFNGLHQTEIDDFLVPNCINQRILLLGQSGGPRPWSIQMARRLCCRL